MRLRFLITVLCLAFAGHAFAADGDIETEDSTFTPKPPAALLANGKEKIARIQVQRLCDAKGSGGAGTGVTCGPIWMPQGGVPFRGMTIRPVKNGSANCGFDNWVIYSAQPINGSCSTANFTPAIGVLDDDGTSTPSGGVDQIVLPYVPALLGPCLYAVGDTTAGTCNASNTVSILVDYIP